MRIPTEYDTWRYEYEHDKSENKTESKPVELVDDKSKTLFINIADRQYAQDFEYHGSCNLVSLSEYGNYYRVMQKNGISKELRTQQHIREEILKHKPRNDGLGKLMQMSSVHDVWMRLNDILTLTPVRVVLDKDLDRQVLIRKHEQKVHKLKIEKATESGVMTTHISENARIQVSISGPSNTLRSPCLMDSGAPTNCMSRSLYVALGYSIEDLSPSQRYSGIGLNELAVLGISNPLPRKHRK